MEKLELSDLMDLCCRVELMGKKIPDVKFMDLLEILAKNKNKLPIHISFGIIKVEIFKKK